MAIICPTVLAANPHLYREQIERLESFADRVQIDIMDGVFAPTKSLNPVQLWWPKGWMVDIHVMFERPLEHLETLISLHPNMIILHAESKGSVKSALAHLKKVSIKAGVALLKETQPEDVRELISKADHVLLFSGDLGHFGGQADLSVLDKISAIKEINPDIEIGWDGGANADNAAALMKAGVDVINVGGAIAKADDPAAAYATLVSKIN